MRNIKNNTISVSIRFACNLLLGCGLLASFLHPIIAAEPGPRKGHTCLCREGRKLRGKRDSKRICFVGHIREIVVPCHFARPMFRRDVDADEAQVKGTFELSRSRPDLPICRTHEDGIAGLVPYAKMNRWRCVRATARRLPLKRREALADDARPAPDIGRGGVRSCKWARAGKLGCRSQRAGRPAHPPTPLPLRSPSLAPQPEDMWIFDADDEIVITLAR